MMRRRGCPRCGLAIDYIEEQIGSVHKCGKCGEQFELVENPGRMIGFLVWATVMGAAAGLGYLAVRVILRLALRPPGPRRQ